MWQEGSTEHAGYEDADVMIMQALDFWRRANDEFLVIPVIKGNKTVKDNFVGGHQTSVVAYIPVSGTVIQGATLHNMRWNFGKIFDITN